MKLINKSPRNYIAFDTVLEAGQILDIKDTKIINILKTQPDVEEYIDKEEVEKLKKEAAKAKEEAKKAKEEVQKAKDSAKASKTPNTKKVEE